MSKNKISVQQLFLIALQDFVIKAKDLESVVNAIKSYDNLQYQQQVRQHQIITLSSLIHILSIKNHIEQTNFNQIQEYLQLNKKQNLPINNWLNSLYYSAINSEENVIIYAKRLNYRQIVYELIMNANSLVKSRNLLLTTVWKHKIKLQSYFADKYGQNCIEGISFSVIKQFMYDKGLFNRYFLNLLKKYLFSNRQTLPWQVQTQSFIQKRQNNENNEDQLENKSKSSFSFNSRRETPTKFTQKIIQKRRLNIEQILQQIDNISDKITKKRYETKSNKNIFSRKRIVSEPKTPHFLQSNSSYEAVNVSIRQPKQKYNDKQRIVLGTIQNYQDKELIKKNYSQRKIQILELAEEKAKLKIKEIERKALSKVQSIKSIKYVTPIIPESSHTQKFRKQIFQGKPSNFGETWNKFACVRRTEKLRL